MSVVNDKSAGADENPTGQGPIHAMFSFAPDLGCGNSIR